MEGELDRRQAARHIVVQVGVQALITAVELGGQAQQDHVTVEGGQAEQAGQGGQAQRHVLAAALRCVLADIPCQLVEPGLDGRLHLRRERDARPDRGADGFIEERVRLGIGDVEGRQFPGLLTTLPAAPHLNAEQQVKALEFSEDVRQ